MYSNVFQSWWWIGSNCSDTTNKTLLELGFMVGHFKGKTSIAKKVMRKVKETEREGQREICKGSIQLESSYYSTDTISASYIHLTHPN